MQCVGFCVKSLDGPITPLCQPETKKMRDLAYEILNNMKNPMVTVWCARLTDKLWTKYILPLSQLFSVVVEVIVWACQYYLNNRRDDDLAQDVAVAWFACYILTIMFIIPVIVKTTHMEHHMVEIFDEEHFKKEAEIDETEAPKDYDRLFIDYETRHNMGSSDLVGFPIIPTMRHKFHATIEITPRCKKYPELNRVGCCGGRDIIGFCGDEEINHSIKSYAKMIYTGRKPLKGENLANNISDIILRYNDGEHYNALKRHCQVFAREIWFLFRDRRRVISDKECVFRGKYTIYCGIRLLMPVYFILGFTVGFTSRISLGCLIPNVLSFSTRFIGYWRRDYVEELAAGEYWICNVFRLAQMVKPADENGDLVYEESFCGMKIPKLLFYFLMTLVISVWNMLYVLPLLVGLLLVRFTSDYHLDDYWGTPERFMCILGGVVVLIVLFIVGTEFDDYCLRPDDTSVTPALTSNLRHVDHVSVSAMTKESSSNASRHSSPSHSL